MIKTVCIISGGIDSACTVAHLKNNKHDIHLLTFYYGQRSRTEVERSTIIADYLHVKEHKIVDISFMKEFYTKSNVLTDTNSLIPGKFDYSIVVPVRNAIFISIASALAFSIDAEMVAYGAHKDDLNYPDCRTEFVKSINEMINLAEIDGIKKGIRKEIKIWSPAMDDIGKKELLKIGYEVLADKLFETWSCYTDGIKHDNELIHCGKCESCVNRKKAFIEAGIEDKTSYNE
ncbi:MAG: 7-cyano-7-deazaguanine synthase QueC [Thaumarchaeota archaeon]|nr:7-cyano-7-deazaguanine synthase QueC [Nitrososphaerota archaeon]